MWASPLSLVVKTRRFVVGASHQRSRLEASPRAEAGYLFYPILPAGSFEIVQLSTGGVTGNHERYLAVYRLVKERDSELSVAFDDMRRSTALVLLASHPITRAGDRRGIRWVDAETQAAVEVILEFWRS